MSDIFAAQLGAFRPEYLEEILRMSQLAPIATPELKQRRLRRLRRGKRKLPTGTLIYGSEQVWVGCAGLLDWRPAHDLDKERTDFGGGVNEP